VFTSGRNSSHLGKLLSTGHTFRELRIRCSVLGMSLRSPAWQQYREGVQILEIARSASNRYITALYHGSSAPTPLTLLAHC